MNKTYTQSLRNLSDEQIAETLGEPKVLDGLLDAIDCEDAIANRVIQSARPSIASTGSGLHDTPMPIERDTFALPGEDFIDRDMISDGHE